MKTKDILISITITLVLGIFIFFIGTKQETLLAPTEVYKVYLNGKSIGFLDSEKEFLDLVDKKQEELKKQYNVKNIYPPKGLKIEKISTYEEDIKSAEEIYQTIENTDPFTIDGYIVTIKYKDKSKDNRQIYLLNKEDFEKAFYNTVAAFVGTNELDNYNNNTQEEIKETGEKIENIYWDEDITIKEDRISTEQEIFTNDDDLSKYLLFGTTEKQKTYVVEDGDSIENIIEKNNLSIEEFLIANPTIPNGNVLLTENQQVSIGLISPIVTIVHEKEVVENITNKYTTEYKDDNSMYAGTKKTLQEGVDGVSKVTENIQYKNGAIEQLVIIKTEEIKPTVNKIVAKGTKTSGGSWYGGNGYSNNYTYINTGNDDWYWPTLSPYVITSGFKWRWGKHHDGLDISGCGFGSPIYSSTDGVVVEVINSCANKGSYGNSCGRQFGNMVRVSIDGGKYYVIYAHMKNDIKVKVGDKVKRGQRIGSMGSSGSSTGTHLHFEIDNSSGTALNPCKVAFKC